MKKLGLIAGAFVLLLGVFIAGAVLWLNGHAEEIARKLTGKDVRFTDFTVNYLPIPTVVLKGLEVREGPHTVTIPEARIYPDIDDIFSGRVSVKKTVLENPLLVAGSFRPNRAESAPNPFFHTTQVINTIPEGQLVVNQGRLILQSASGGAVPVSLSAQAEKADQRISITVTDASIKEIGLEFSGNVTTESISPLQCTINATRGTFNPSAIKDFLLRFGYLSEEASHQVPDIQHIEIEDARMSFDEASPAIGLTAKALHVDKNRFQDLSCHLEKGDAFSLQWESGLLDAKQAYEWLLQTKDGKRVLDDLFHGSGISSVTPEGAIEISSLRLVGGLKKRQDKSTFVPFDGVMQIRAQGLSFELLAENAEKQQITFDQLDVNITIDQGEPSIQLNQLSFASPRGGSGTITGSFTLPLDPHELVVKSSIDALTVFDTILTAHLHKEEHSKATFRLSLDMPRLHLSSAGQLYMPGQTSNRVEARLSHLHVVPKPDPEAAPLKKQVALDQPFDAGVIKNRNFSAKVFIKNFQVGEQTRMRDVDLHLQAANHQAVLNGSIRMCGVHLILGAVVMPPGSLFTTLETKGTDVDLTSLIACFSKELPIYLSGRLFVSGSFSSTGDSPQAVVDGAQGDVTITLHQAVIRRIAGLDPRLNFILDILRAARISSEQESTITVNRGMVNANLQDGRFVLNRFSMVGPMLSAWGRGEFVIKDKHLKLSGGVRTKIGVTRGLAVDRYLKEEGT